MLQMMTNMDFYVTPVLNIDGYIYSWENITVGTSVPWIFTKLILRGCWRQSHKWKRDEIIKACTISRLIFFWGVVRNFSILSSHSQNEWKQWSKIANDFDPSRIDCGGRTGHPDLRTAAVMALISTATLMPTGAVSLFFTPTHLNMTAAKIHVCVNMLQ